MRYQKTFTIPAGTLEETPATSEIMLSAGTITEVEITVPPGHAGLVFLQIFHGPHQIYPTTPGESFCGDDLHYTFDESYELTDTPISITLVGWAPDANYDHVFIVQFTVESASGYPYSFLTSIPIPMIG